MPEQLLKRILKSLKFVIQFDDSTDISNSEQLLTYGHYFFENHVREDLLFCQPLEGRIAGEHFFVKLSEFFNTVIP